MARESPSARFRQRMLRWALRRQGVDTLPLKLAPRRIYILPTRAGWTFALLVVAMFLAGMNYGNGLALLLAFWLTGFALVAMIRTQRTLAGAHVLRAVPAATFAGDALPLTLEIRSTLTAADLQITAQDLQGVEPLPAGGADTCLLRLQFNTHRRGRWRAPVMQLQTSAPFGLFRTWTWLALDTSGVVYPRPLGERRPPETPGAEQGAQRLAGSLDEVAGLRPWREGDSPRQVAWKAYARGAPLLVREYQGHAAATVEFDYSLLPVRGREERLSQLSRWVVDAAAQNQQWTLRLPGKILNGSGAEHRRRSLEELALFEAELTS
jgi:uncharacterized protein (DUF58 family)